MMGDAGVQENQVHTINVQSIPEKDLQGFHFLDPHIALSTHFSWQVEYGRHESGNLVNLFLDWTVLLTWHQAACIVFPMTISITPADCMRLDEI